MSYYIKVSPLLRDLIKEIEESSSDDLSYELWRDVCINDGWVEVNVQQDDWVDSIKDDTKRELVMAYNSLNQDLKWNTKKRKRGSSEKVMRLFLLKKTWKVTGNT